MRRSGSPVLGAALLVALLVTLLAPIRGAWACPDGTPCASSKSSRGAAQGMKCALHDARQPDCCKHGRRDSNIPSLEGIADCRFTVTSASHGPALTGSRQALPDLEMQPAPAAPEHRIIRVVWSGKPADGPSCRPPPISPSAAPRAPPS